MSKRKGNAVSSWRADDGADEFRNVWPNVVMRTVVLCTVLGAVGVYAYAWSTGADRWLGALVGALVGCFIGLLIDRFSSIEREQKP